VKAGISAKYNVSQLALGWRSVSAQAYQNLGGENIGNGGIIVA